MSKQRGSLAVIVFITTTLIILLATVSPGPDFAIVSRNALRYTQRAGIMTALGVASGTLFHSLYCILGFAIIISRSLLLFTIIKTIGAGYLIYLGIKGLLEKQSSTPVEGLKTAQHLSSFLAFRQGFFCTALNPKAILFFLAFFTVIIKPTMPLYLQATYAFEIALIDLAWFSAVSVFFAHNNIKVKLGKGLHYMTKLCGGVLILFGLKIAAFT